MTSTPNNGRVQGMDEVPRGLGVPQASIFRRAAFALVLLLLLATPLLLVMAAVSTGSALHDVVERLTAIWFPFWAVFAVWVALDASALYGFAGPRPDPLGPKALGLSGLAVANIVSMFLFLIVTKGK
jgi:hypothetical protein